MTHARWIAVVITTSLVVGACGRGDDDTRGDASSPSSEPATTATSANEPTPTTEELTEGPPEAGTNAGVIGDLRLGDSVHVGTTSVSANGGTVEIERGTLTGLSIDVPAGAFASSTDFDITLTAIPSDTFGQAVVPLSPLVTVDNGGAHSDELMTVRVPVRIPSGMFAMGFLYDDGVLEGLPLVDEAPDHVTIATGHFSSFFIAAIERSLLPDEVATGYRVGEDNWQFVNNGSFPHPGGICAGMSLTSIWYFTERKASEGQLWDRWDDDGRNDTPDFWYDDAWALRWATAAQRAYRNAHSRFEKYSDLVGAAPSGHRLQYDAFRYAMYLTGQPQIVGLLDASQELGHAMVVYAHTPGRLWVADPNYPKGLREIRFDETTDAFLPFSSGTDANAIATGGSVSLVSFAYYAASALVSWPALEDQYERMQAGVVGAGIFPSYDVLVRTLQADGTYVVEPLRSGFETSLPAIELGVRPTPDADVYLYEGTEPDPTGRFNAPSGRSTFVSVPLALGTNDIGIRLEGGPSSSAPAEWLDFRRFSIRRAEGVTTTVPPVTAPPTTPPPATAPPATAPPQTRDCTGLTGLALVECSLQNEGISEAP